MNVNDFLTFISKKKILFYIIWGTLFLLAFTPNLYLFFNDEKTIKNIFFLLLGLSFCLFPALFLKSKIYFGIYFLFVLVAPLEIGHIIVNKIPLTSGFLLTLSNTNSHEIMSYLSSFKLMIVLAVMYWGFYIFLWIKIPNQHLLHAKKKKIGIFFYLVLFLGISVLATVSFIRQSEKTSAKDIKRNVIYGFKIKLLKTYPYNIGWKSYYAWSEKKELLSRYEKIKDFRFHPEIKNDDDCEIYVFVMGESARYANFGINGYERNTTPYLDSLNREGKLLTFSNVFASGNLTNYVHPILLTRTTVLERNIMNEEKSLVSLFKEAGFKTYILSNQGENEIFLRQIVLEADYGYINNNDFSFDEKYDGVLLPQIDSILDEKNNKKCLFLFTLGNHYKYNFRYPPQFEKFKPTFDKSLFTYEIVEKNKELFVNAYDNAVLYTDYFIHEIIQRLDQKNCKTSLFYISDHGENIFDTPKVSLGHGTLTPTKYELHIPMFIWFSDSYIKDNDSIFMNLKNNLDKSINSSHIFYTFSNIAGIQYHLYQKESDVSSKEFLPDSIHTVLNPDLEILKIKEW